MRAGSVLRTIAPAAALGAVLALPPACGTSAVGVDACKQVESARCQAASACGVSLEPPYHTAGSDQDACIRFYDVACLHGLASGSDPGPAAVSACVAAISSHPCAAGGPNLVLHPEQAPGSACAWLVPPASTPAADAAAEAAEGGDAASE
jgi:hypothetical protein